MSGSIDRLVADLRVVQDGVAEGHRDWKREIVGDARAEVLSDLIERLLEKEITLNLMADEPHHSAERVIHLRSKCEGVALARGFAEEALREVRRG